MAEVFNQLTYYHLGAFTMNKRDFLKNSTVLGVTGSIVSPSSVLAHNFDRSSLKDITGDAKSITVDERKARVSKAQKIMRKMNIDMLLIEAGSALIYFTGEINQR